MKTKNTSWQKVSPWYKRIVGYKGHNFHQALVIPNILRLLNLTGKDSVLDLACGNGVLERYLNPQMPYLGVDNARSLIEYAEKNKKSKLHKFLKRDITKPIQFDYKFTKTVIILALQNVSDQKAVIKTAKNLISDSGELLIVLNHPFYRIPKNSFWQEDAKNNSINRMVTKYMSTFSENILAHPSKGTSSPKTITIHFPLSYLTQIIKENGFIITNLEEWVSEKRSVGAHAKAENKARKEFPMFMAMLCKKI